MNSLRRRCWAVRMAWFDIFSSSLEQKYTQFEILRFWLSKYYCALLAHTSKDKCTSSTGYLAFGNICVV